VIVNLGTAPTICYPTAEDARKAGEKFLCPLSMPRSIPIAGLGQTSVLDQCWENTQVREREGMPGCWYPFMEGQAYYTGTGKPVAGFQAYPTWLWMVGAAAAVVLLLSMRGSS